jgi:hypothetical protein
MTIWSLVLVGFAFALGFGFGWLWNEAHWRQAVEITRRRLEGVVNDG